MTDYKSILVYVDFHGPKPERLKFAAGLATRFGATLIAVASGEVPQAPTPLGRDRFIRFEQSEIEAQLQVLRKQVNDLLGPALTVEWRGVVGSPTLMVAEEAQAADLIVASSHEGSDMAASDVGDLAITAGRPVLVPASNVSALVASRVLIGWKNTRESRRAVRDAMPFLVGAEQVLVATVGRGDEPRLVDDLPVVVEYLQRHGVAAQSALIEPDHGRHVADMLVARAQAEGSDLVVTGAYGHSRLREWAFGGVTLELLNQDAISVLLSN